ncbi:Reverse transcriptase domain [Trinorchestia longiramus]|nr:Reverse transcriptase domain [Trinorchestia longiramus]
MPTVLVANTGGELLQLIESIASELSHDLFANLSIGDKKAFIRQHKRCYRCLGRYIKSDYSTSAKYNVCDDGYGTVFHHNPKLNLLVLPFNPQRGTQQRGNDISSPPHPTNKPNQPQSRETRSARINCLTTVQVVNVVLFHKDGHKRMKELENYRPIALADTVSKIFCEILNERMKHVVEEQRVMGEEQNDFSRDRRGEDNLFVVSEIIERKIKENKKVYLAFLDIEKAYDRVDRRTLLDVLGKIGFSE